MMVALAAVGFDPEPSRVSGLAEAHSAIKVPLYNHQDKPLQRFLEGCPALNWTLARDFGRLASRATARRKTKMPQRGTATAFQVEMGVSYLDGNVIAGLAPAIHPLFQKMDARIKSAHDDG